MGWDRNQGALVRPVPMLELKDMEGLVHYHTNSVHVQDIMYTNHIIGSITK